jgi:hypothetical protein
MEGSDRIKPVPIETSALVDAARYYADLEIATSAFTAAGQDMSQDTSPFHRRTAFGIPGIVNWSVWSTRRAVDSCNT